MGLTAPALISGAPAPNPIPGPGAPSSCPRAHPSTRSSCTWCFPRAPKPGLRALRHWERVTRARSLQPGPHLHNLPGPRSPSTCSLAASGLGAEDHSAHNAPRPLASARLGGGTRLALPRHALPGHTARSPTRPATVSPKVRTQRAQKSRAHDPRQFGTQPLLSPPSRRPLVTRPWSPRAGYSPCLHPAPGAHPGRPRAPRSPRRPPQSSSRAVRAFFVPTHPAPDSRHTGHSSRLCRRSPDRDWKEASPPPPLRPTNSWLQVSLGRGPPPDLCTACRADTPARSSRALSFRFIYPETCCMASPTRWT